MLLEEFGLRYETSPDATSGRKDFASILGAEIKDENTIKYMICIRSSLCENEQDKLPLNVSHFAQSGPVQD